MVLNFRRIFGSSRPREERSSAMVLTVTEDTPADMLAGSMELLVQMPRDHHVQTQRVTVQRSTPMMDLLVQIATAHKLSASSYTLQAIGERGLVLPYQPNTPIGALDALQVKLLPKQGTFLPRKNRPSNQPFEMTFRLQVHLPRNQLYVSRVSPKTNLGEILGEVCREKNLDRNKYELRHPANIAETLDLSLSLQDYHLQEVTLCARQQSRTMMGSALSSQDIMALQKQEELRRNQSRQSVFGFMFKKSKESSLSTDSLGNRSVSPARSDETARSSSPVNLRRPGNNNQQQPPPPPARPLRKRRPAPKPPTQQQPASQTTNLSRTESKNTNESSVATSEKDKIIISHSRNSSDSSGYHEASVLSDNPDNGAVRMPETLPRRGRMQGILETPRKLAHTSQTSKSLGNLAMASSHGGTLSRGISNTSLSSAGQRKKRAAPPPPIARPLPSAISAQGLERIVDSDESLTSDMDLSKPSSDIDVAATGSSKASSDIACHVHPIVEQPETVLSDDISTSTVVESARVVKKEPAPPVPKPRKILKSISPSVSSSSSNVEQQQKQRFSPADASRASVSSSCSRSSSCINPTASVVEVASFGLPSLTEDEREEIAMAIDSIVEAAQAHDIEDASLIGEESLNQRDLDDDDPTKKSSSNGNYEETKTNDVTVDNHEPAMPEKSVLIETDKEDVETETTDGKKVDSVTVAEEDVKIEISAERTLGTEPVNNDEESVAAPSQNVNKEDKSNERPEMTRPSEPRPKEVKFEPSAENDSNIGPSSCAVISTIPKCDHLEPYTDGDFGKPLVEHAATKKRGKIARSQSEMSRFDFGPAEKHSRHLTTNGEAFTFALNPNLGEAATRRIEASITGSGKSGPTETDILLQKVSDTLSHSLTPPSPPPTPEDSSLETSGNSSSGIRSTAKQSEGFDNLTDDKKSPSITTTSVKKNVPEMLPMVKITHEESTPQQQKHQQDQSAEDERLVTSSINPANLTHGSQQDTSDYVSASGEDLSIGDWEYQIPAPPSGFRDNSDDDDDDEEVIVDSTEIGKKNCSVPCIEKPSVTNEADIHDRTKSSNLSVELLKPSENLFNFVEKIEEPEYQSSKVDSTVDSVDFCNSKVFQCSTNTTESKKAEVISELETKINSNKPIVEPIISRDECHAPKIAPIENNLSNFTITTYSRQKSLDIFEQMDQQQHNENRVLSTFATLTRGKSMAADYGNEKSIKSGMLKSAQSMEKMSMPLVEDRTKFAERNDILREKPTVHRSKSYIVLSSNEKFHNRTNEIEKIENEKNEDRLNYDSSKKFTSLANVNKSMNEEIPRHKEKFSQWRENILRKQEEPTKEKQLQSLQVLKSILPQLKNAQVTEENGYKNTTDDFTSKKRQESQHEQNQDSSTISSTATELQLRATRRTHEPTKRYTYGGPPAVSLGSWSERPCVNVQIKTDTDYKFGGNSNSSSASGARTVVNLNGSGGVETSERIQNGVVSTERKENGKPSPVDVEKKDESLVDTTSVNFRELTKTFGQADVRMRTKPPITTRNPQNRNSEYIERPKHEIVAPKLNGFADSHVTTTTSTFGVAQNRNNAPVPPVKRYTSIIGIANNNNNNNDNNVSSQHQSNFRFANGKAKMFNNQKERENNVPKPPTMPIITGVTLKSVSARPKSNPLTIQADPRDQLLESIRNFGGRGNLKSVADRY